MATDGSIVDQWLRDAKIARGKLTAEQLAVLGPDFAFWNDAAATTTPFAC